MPLGLVGDALHEQRVSSWRESPKQVEAVIIGHGPRVTAIDPHCGPGQGFTCLCIENHPPNHSTYRQLLA